MSHYNNRYFPHINNGYNYGGQYPSPATGIQNSHRNSATRAKSFSKEEAAAIALLLGIDFCKSKFDLNEFWMGVNTELEHGKISSQTNVTDNDPLMTGKIALAHLNEFPDYYKRLKVLEEEAKAFWNK
ncbi:DUF5661 family protein [Mesobacillus subterraneus]|uniref:DUF5661 family protein n=1 Tax=Mesobacillus subterraneus TaxID=285983 RepID=UPI001FE6703A|nr:DUF5661 family protein [Mesobacillus subterraneus]